MSSNVPMGKRPESNNFNTGLAGIAMNYTQITLFWEEDVIFDSVLPKHSNSRVHSVPFRKPI